MPLNVINPVADYNAAHGTSYAGQVQAKGVYVASAGEVWQMLASETSAGYPIWLRIDEPTATAIALADNPTGATGPMIFGDILPYYDALNDLVIASGYDNYTPPYTSARKCIFAWNPDGTVAWEQYWTPVLDNLSSIGSNPNVPGSLSCVQYDSSVPIRKIKSIDPSTGAFSDIATLPSYFDLYRIVIDNDGAHWIIDYESGTYKIKKLVGGSWVTKATLSGLADWLSYDPLNDKIAWADRVWPVWTGVLWDVQSDSLDTSVTLDGFIGDNIRAASFDSVVSAWSNSNYVYGSAFTFDLSTFSLIRHIRETGNEETPEHTTFRWFTSPTRAWSTAHLTPPYGDPGFVIWDRCTGEMSLFIGCESEPLISRVRISDLTYRDKADSGTGSFSEDPEGFGFVGCVRIGKYGYFVQESSTDNKDGMWMFKVDLTTNSQVGALFLDNPRTSVWPYAYSACADTSNENIYILYSSYNASGGGGDVVIFKVRVSDFSVLATLDLSATYSNYSSAYWLNDLFVCSDDYLFVHVTESSPSPYQPTLLRIDLSSFTLDATVSTSGGWSGSSWTTGYNELNCGLLGSDGYIYCGATDNAATTERAVVLKIDPWTPSIESALAIRSDTTTSAAIVTSLTTDGTYLYATDSGFGVPSSDPKIAKIFIYEFTLDASATLTNDNYPVPKEAVMVDGSIYLIGYQAPRDGGSTGVLRAWEVKASDLTVVREVDLALTRNQYVSQRPLLYCFSAAVEAIRRWVTININMRRR